MADGSNRGSVDAMSSQGSDEVFYNVVDEVGNSSHSVKWRKCSFSHFKLGILEPKH